MGMDPALVVREPASDAVATTTRTKRTSLCSHSRLSSCAKRISRLLLDLPPWQTRLANLHQLLWITDWNGWPPTDSISSVLGCNRGGELNGAAYHGETNVSTGTTARRRRTYPASKTAVARAFNQVAGCLDVAKRRGRSTRCPASLHIAPPFPSFNLACSQGLAQILVHRGFIERPWRAFGRPKCRGRRPL